MANPKKKKSKPVPKPEVSPEARTILQVRKATFADAGKVALIIILFCIPLLGKFIGSKMAMLYLLADNGKKSGRADGNVYMRNNRIRGFRVPSIVRNSYTSSVRAIFATFSSIYRNLTQSQIESWLSFSYTKTDRFGKLVNVNGKQAYVGLNANIATVGGTAIVAPPIGGTSPASTQIVSLDISTGGTIVKLTYDINADGATTLIRATSPLSAGVFRPSKSAYRDVGVFDSSAASPYTFSAAYITKFGIVPVGAKVFVQLKVIDAVTGLDSALTEISGISI